MGGQVWVMSLGSKFSTAFLLGGLHLFVQAAIKDGSPGMGNEPRLEMFDCISIRSVHIRRLGMISLLRLPAKMGTLMMSLGLMFSH